MKGTEMKAVVFERTGGPEVLHIGEVETPVPGAGQVLIKTAYAGLNFADIGRRTGLYGPTPLPGMFGLEGSGTVESVGPSVTGIELGARVLGFLIQGSCAEYFLAGQEKVATVPPTMTLEQAAGVPQVQQGNHHGPSAQRPPQGHGNNPRYDQQRQGQ